MDSNIYRDIATRTGGDIYIGVVGPVRSGKSTFIKSFMEEMVLPKIDDVYLKERAKDELPQSGSGRTIMTAEPKFVPEEAVCVTLDNKCSFNVRMIDCVGYMIPGAVGEFEDDTPRMITTSWFDHEIPLAQAAEVGTKKVICEHSTVGIVVTTDGSIGDIPREDYVNAEERIVNELKDINKPFCVLINCVDPTSQKALTLQSELTEKYGVPCRAVNCMSIKSDEIDGIISNILHQFPVKEYSFSLPEWIMYLPENNQLRKDLYKRIYSTCENAFKMQDAENAIACIRDETMISDARIREIDTGKGCIFAQIEIPSCLFYETLSSYCGIKVENEGHLMEIMRDTARIRDEYAHISGALEQVRQTGYGIVMPAPCELTLEQPEIIKQGGRSGVRLKASAPSIHMIRADIETEINPVVGSEKQSEDLVQYLLSEFEDSPEKIWDTNIFGKSLSELVNEGLNNKLYKMPDEARAKFRQTLERMINEGSGGLICIIL
ncbi:MAG: stage IV sporulation protein A [Clostridia bacterium]|nr:stage IV sporulation protein A [Clostridia bacterium]